MPVLNYTSRELTTKIVYYGPALSGKTTNVKKISEMIPEKRKGKMVTLPTKEDRTLFFDFLPFSLETKTKYKVRIQLYTVPGQVFYESTRRLVLQGADGVVFVADSQKELLDNNLESLESMKKNLKLNGLDYTTIPLVLQYNKRDLPNILPVEKLDIILNELARPSFPSIAIRGQGVLETLSEIVELTLKSLKRKYTILEDMNIPELMQDFYACFKQEPQVKEETPFTFDREEKKENIEGKFLGFKESTVVKNLPEEEEATPTGEEEIIEIPEARGKKTSAKEEKTDSYKKEELFKDFQEIKEDEISFEENFALENDGIFPEEKEEIIEGLPSEPVEELPEGSPYEVLPEEFPEEKEKPHPMRKEVSEAGTKSEKTKEKIIEIPAGEGISEIPIKLQLTANQDLEVIIKLKIEVKKK